MPENLPNPLRCNTIRKHIHHIRHTISTICVKQD